MKAESSDCAHIYTRGRWPTRWDLTNAVGLCRPCHAHYTDHPNQWEEWVIAVVFDNDEVAYGQLGYQSTATERGAPSVDVDFVLTRLEEVAYMDEQLFASIFISPAGTRHYDSGKQRYGLPLTLCGVGVDLGMGWGRGNARNGNKDCSRCEDKVAQ